MLPPPQREDVLPSSWDRDVAVVEESVGAGLGLVCSTAFRVATPDSRFGATADHRDGVAATAARRTPRFVGA